MRRLFIQFYLLLLGSLLVGMVGIGAVYRHAVNSLTDHYLSDLLKGTLLLAESSLRGVPEPQWGPVVARLEQGLTYPLRIEPLGAYALDAPARAALARGEVVMLEGQNLFLQQIQHSQSMLVAGPLDYLHFLQWLQWMDYSLLLLIAVLLALPVLWWMRPHWRQLMALAEGARRFGRGELGARVALPAKSPLAMLGGAFNQMADNIATQVASKKALTDAIAHELRTPLARLRYRLTMAELAEPERNGVERELDALDSLLEELLLHARLDVPDAASTVRHSNWHAREWLRDRLDSARLLAPQLDWQLDCPPRLMLTGDARLIGRALDNLLGNAARYARGQVRLRVASDGGWFTASVEDDGPGIALADRQRVFEPFVRLEAGRSQPGHGLGLAIVAAVARAHGGRVEAGQSAAGGASLSLSWPVLHSVTDTHHYVTDGRGAAL